MSEFLPVARLPTNARSEHKSISTQENELKDPSTASSKDGSVYKPAPSEEDGLKNQPPFSDVDEPNYEPHRIHKTDDEITIHQISVTSNQHHLSANTDLEVGTVIRIGETSELPDGSFLNMTSFGKSKRGRSVTGLGHLSRHIKEFEDLLPVTPHDSEVIQLCAMREQDCKSEGFLRSAIGNDVIRIRQLASLNSQSASESISQSRAMGNFADNGFLLRRWKLLAELSHSQLTGEKKIPQAQRKFRSKDSQGRPKALTALSSQSLFGEEIEGADVSSQHKYLDGGILRDSSNGGPSQQKEYGRAEVKKNGKGEGPSTDPRMSVILVPISNGNRIAKATPRVARRNKSSRNKLDL